MRYERFINPNQGIDYSLFVNLGEQIRDLGELLQLPINMSFPKPKLDKTGYYQRRINNP